MGASCVTEASVQRKKGHYQQMPREDFVVYVDLEGNGTGDRPGVSGDASFLIPTGKFGGSLRPPSNSVRTH